MNSKLYSMCVILRFGSFGVELILWKEVKHERYEPSDHGNVRLRTCSQPAYEYYTACNRLGINRVHSLWILDEKQLAHQGAHCPLFEYQTFLLLNPRLVQVMAQQELWLRFPLSELIWHERPGEHNKEGVPSTARESWAPSLGTTTLVKDPTQL